MNPVTLTANEFKTIHNALCDLQWYGDNKVVEQVEAIREALQGAYKQEREIMDRRYDHYSQVKKDAGLTSIWSISEVEDLNDTHPYEGVKYVSYKDHWGNGVVTQSINGSTWAALYVAANACIRDSGDEHHVYIEGFKQQGNTLVLITGS
jgi:hypothetical protein